MQITLSMIERIAQRVFSMMFLPSLKKANVSTDGTALQADHADISDKALEADHADTADTALEADRADAADSVEWTGVADCIQNGVEFNVCDESPDDQELYINKHQRDGDDMSDPITDYYFCNGAGSTSGVTLHAAVFDNSDENLKDIQEQIVLDIDEIANAPLVRFRWKSEQDGSFHVGTIAQYWEKVLPEVVSANKKGELSLNYATAALISVVSLAKEVSNIKKRLE